MGLDISIYRGKGDRKNEVITLRKCYEVRQWVMECLAKRYDFLNKNGKFDENQVYSCAPLSGVLSTDDMMYIRDKCASYLQDIDLNHLVKHNSSNYNDWQILYTYMVIQRLRPDLIEDEWYYDDTG